MRSSRRQVAELLNSDEAIEVVSMIRFFFKQPLRATFTGSDGTSRVRSAGARLFDFIQKLEVKLGKLKSKGKRIHVVLDSTGLKVFGEGEWKVASMAIQKVGRFCQCH
jgi:hypothetical protein